MASIEDMVRQLGEKEQVIAFYAYQELLQVVTRAGQPGKESARETVAGELTRELTATVPGGVDRRGNPLPPKPKHSAAIRNKVARLVSYVGGEKEVAALEQALLDLEIREMARFALEINASEAATNALVAALEQVGPIFRTGVVNSLGRRKGASVLAALQKAAVDPEREVRLAAVEALANFADPSSDALLAQACDSGSPQDRKRAHAARVRLADSLRQAG
ncbi:MAG: HEAT repeat domain-containing protein, partial [Gammaproteobacteria bacterium]